MANFFDVRAEIAEKLKEITEFKQIYTPINSVSVTEMGQVTPAAHVNFHRVRKIDDAGKGKSNLLGLQWSVTVACRNAKAQLNDITALADEAGELLNKVIQLLSGWELDNSIDPLQIVDVKDGYGPAFVYYTVIFESTKIIGAA
ncbi:hypothetical protein F900_01403 [Acinetobacter modestus]|uniref:Uncharacterized protein n=1 Tax=Acinetobacter modestus TaxID=1776740 RepID=N9M1E7_9GAMM|nr:hypothetical protein [Acinetobacter modestus]ENX02339.1 hypothetical protein F900_01403 [Acinetobacter modestus]